MVWRTRTLLFHDPTGEGAHFAPLSLFLSAARHTPRLVSVNMKHDVITWVAVGRKMSLRLFLHKDFALARLHNHSLPILR